MDPNSPVNNQQQMQDQQQGGVSAQEPVQSGEAQPTSAEPQVTTAPSEPTISQPPMGDETSMQTGGAVDQSQQAVTSETQEVPEQVNPIDTSAQPASTVPNVGGVAPLGENGGSNNPPQSA